MSSSLRSIRGKLAAKRFVFLPARGVLIKKSGSSKKRPVVIAPIDSRIVQRAILEIVQGIPAIGNELHAGFNFGGIDGTGFGVPGAVAKAVRCAQQGGYFIRTDIKSFFTAVPRQKAIDGIAQHFNEDSEFAKIFAAAATTELVDAASFGEDLQLFPIADAGVAQGSSLSPLLCNYLLKDFDRDMNDKGVTCIRYIDDFILFAKNKNTVSKAFKSALNKLSALGLKAYDPFDPADAMKAEHGHAKMGFTFLGCEISPSLVRPTNAKKEELLSKVKELFQTCCNAAARPDVAIRSREQIETYAGATIAASNIIRAWGNTYSFCSDDRLMGSIDAQLEAAFTMFRARFDERLRSLSASDRRRARGLFCLADCNRDSNEESARVLSQKLVKA